VIGSFNRSNAAGESIANDNNIKCLVELAVVQFSAFRARNKIKHRHTPVFDPIGQSITLRVVPDLPSMARSSQCHIRQRSTANRTVANTRTYTDFWQGAAIDRVRLTQSIARPEEAAKELQAVAKKGGGECQIGH
jgi:hypothetical protein